MISPAPDIDSTVTAIKELLAERGITSYIFGIWREGEGNKGSWRTRWDGNDYIIAALAVAIWRGQIDRFSFQESKDASD